MSWDLVVVGGGPGGYAAAIRACQLGLKTALVERDAVGGTCLNRGCIPTKALLHSAGLYREMLGAVTFGVTAENVSFDYGAVDTRKNQVVAQLREGVERLLKGNGVEVFRCSAQIEGPGRVRAGEAVLETENILIATGAKPALPPVPGLDLPGVLTSDDLLREGKFHDRLVIVGGGVIGMEFASLYSSFGAQVTVLEAMNRMLPSLDREIGQNLTVLLKKRGVRMVPSARLERVEQGPGGLTCRYSVKSGEETAAADAVLVAVGRRADTEGLCAPGVDLGLDRDAIPVSEKFETCIPGIYAVGDVVRGNIQLAHMASSQGICAVSAMAGREPPIHLAAVPSCVYTDPEISCVGLTEAQAKEGKIPVKVSKYLMSGNGRTVIASSDRGFIKVVSHGETDVVLGAQLMCERATDLIGEFTAAVADGKTLEELAKVVRPHPTFSEGITEAVESGLGLAIHQLGR